MMKEKLAAKRGSSLLHGNDHKEVRKKGESGAQLRGSVLKRLVLYLYRLKIHYRLRLK